MQELFSYHVEIKEFTPLVVKRSIKIYIDQFDPERTYLLKDEVLPFLDMDVGKVAKVIEHYHKDDFSEFFHLNEIISNAIHRARKWRHEAEEALIAGDVNVDGGGSEDYSNFASSPSDLKKRIYNKLAKRVLHEKEESHSWSSNRCKKLIDRNENRQQHAENFYLFRDERGNALSKNLKEHHFATRLLKAMAQSLDAHTSFYTADEAFEMRASLQKQFEGVGVVLKEKIDGVMISDLIEGGPAKKSGQIEIGDFLVEVDQQPLQDLPFEEVLGKMKGDDKKKEMVLGLKRITTEGGEQFLKVALKKEKIVMNDERLTYSVEPFGDGAIGKIDMPAFYENEAEFSCESDLKAAIRTMRKQHKLLGLILDLRSNAGGFLGQAVKVSGLFITSGIIVVSKYSDNEVRYFRELDGRVYYDGPLIILTSKASASAAEIVAQALQDYGIALIVGDKRTYGKGSMQYQTITDENASLFYKVTVGRFYTVSGKSTQIDGVSADIVVPTIFSPYNIGERFLEFPLKNDRLEAVYQDPLSDVDMKHKKWLQRNYLPYIQKQDVRWSNMIPLLRANSSHRLSTNTNFKAFLKLSETGFSGKRDWGEEDLQMAEAVNIIKDAIHLRQN